MKRLLPVAVGIILTLSGCALRQKGQSQSAGGLPQAAAPTGASSGSSDSASTNVLGKQTPADIASGGAKVAASPPFGTRPKVLFPDPGPFKTVVLKAGDGSCVEALQSRGEPGIAGGTFTISTFGSGPKTFNYWAASDVESSGIGLLMFERLVETDAWTGKTYPRLARSFKVSKDGLSYTMTLRRGLKWSDGKPLTADDVVFTIGTIVAQGYGNSSLRDVLSVYGKFPTVKKIDDLTVCFTTAVPFAPFLNSLKGIPIAPRHIFEPVTRRPKAEFTTFWDVNMKPEDIVVSGPFKLKRYVPGQRVELERNPSYFMVDRNKQSLPYIDKFVVAIVPDQNTQILRFYGQEIDMLDIRSVRGFDAALMKQKELQGNFQMYNLGPDDGTLFLMFNMCRRKNPATGKFYVDPIKQKWFNNRKFRWAVSRAVNRQRIVDNVLRGVGLPLYTSESVASVYFNKQLEPYPQDLEAAARLLKEGGFVLKDGQLFDADNHRVEFTLLTNAGNTTRDGICVTIAEELKKLGMKVNYQPIDFNILIDKTETSLDWEAVVMGLTGNKIEPYDGANVWKSDGRLHMFDQRLPDKDGTTRPTDARAWEKRIDRLFDLGATTLSEQKRHEYFAEYQKIAYDEQPYIYIDTALDITAIRNTIGNYRPTPLGIYYTPVGSLHNVEEIYFRKRPH